MASFDSMMRALFPFLIIWALYTFLIYRKYKRCGASFMNLENVLFVGYIGFTIGLIVTAIVSTWVIK